MTDFPPEKSWNLSLPSQCWNLLHEIKNLSFLVENNHQTINNPYETLNINKKFQSTGRKENCIILEPNGINSDRKRKIPKLDLYDLPDDRIRKKPWTGRVGLKNDIQERAEKVKIESAEKSSKYSTIKSIVELQTQEDDVNKENEIDEGRKGFKNFFKNTKRSVTKEDLEDITNKRMLSDNIIHGFDVPCRRQFEHVAGHQDPLLGQTSQYLAKKSQKFAQI